MIAHDTSKIPVEMRQFKQWVCHDFAKVPLNPYTGTAAKVNNENTWGSFDDAIFALNAGIGIGLGFVFTENDPFFGIDLDVAEGRSPTEFQNSIYRRFLSYAERSPSGRGLHIICKGRVPNGSLRRSELGIEIYSSRRYFTMTGIVERDVQIVDLQFELDVLCSEIAYKNSHNPDIDKLTTSETDDAIVIKAKNAINGEKFLKLWEGRWEADYPSQSEADQALIGIIAFYTKSPAQISRIFRASALGQRPKAARDEYVYRTIKNSLNGVSPSVSFTTAPQNTNMAIVGQAADCADAGWFAASEFIGKPIPARHWHVPGLLPVKQVTALYGDGGTGKSMIAMQLAVATAVGTPWLAKDVYEGNVIYLSAEDDIDEIHRRLHQIGNIEAMRRLTFRSLAGEDALLAITHGRTSQLIPTPLFNVLDARMASERPALLVLDTLADFFGGNENDRAQVRAFIGMLRGLAIRHNCAVLLLAHPSASGLSSGAGSSGSTAWNNSVRSRLYLSRVFSNDGQEANPDARLLTVKKSNYGPVGEEILLLWEAGTFVAKDYPAGSGGCETRAEGVFLKLLDKLHEQGRFVNSAAGQTYAPTVFASHPESDGISKRAFTSAMNRLFNKGLLENVASGPPSKRRRHIERRNLSTSLFRSASNTPTTPSPNPFPSGGVPPPHTP